GTIFEEVLAHYLARQVLMGDQSVDVTLRLLGDSERRDVHSTLTRMLGERSPTGADIEHAPSGLDAARLDRGVEFAADTAIERLVVALEIAMRVAAVHLVQKQEVKIGLGVVMLSNPLLVA